MSGHKEALQMLASQADQKELQRTLQAAQVITDLVSPHNINLLDHHNHRVLDRALVESTVRDYSIEGVDKNFLASIWDAYLHKASAQTDIRLVTYFAAEHRDVTTVYLGMDNDFGPGPQRVLGETGNTILFKLSYQDETYMYPSLLLTLNGESNLSAELLQKYKNLPPFDQVAVIGHYALAIDAALNAAT
jgi:hypothetical protein